MFCQYANIFGKPNEGIHSYRLFNIAIVDVIFTILTAYLISYYFYNKKYFGYILLILFTLAIVMHYIFCVQTTVNRFINNYIL